MLNFDICFAKLNHFASVASPDCEVLVEPFL